MEVSSYDGATIIKSHSKDVFGIAGSGVTLGCYIVGNNTIKAAPNNSLFQHEYGHYRQSQEFGWLYLPKCGIPSLFSKSPHNSHPVEQDANIRGYEYFKNKTPNFKWDNSNKIYPNSKKLTWNGQDFITGLLTIGTLVFAPYLYPSIIVVPGLFNSLFYNYQY